MIHAWKSASTAVVIDFDSALRDSPLKAVGLITAIDDNRISLALELTGSEVVRVGTRDMFRRMNLDPTKYREMVEFSLGNMDRLTLAAPVEA